MHAAVKPPKPITLQFADDGLIPNNPSLPLILYRGGIDLSGSPDPEKVIEKTFGKNGWRDIWRNGIYPYAHYHSMIHEAMGIARGRAWVRFGGENGEVLEVAPGDVVILPAGTGHQCINHTPELVVIGAYPQAGTYNLCRATKAEHAKALNTIPSAPLPETDPAFGPEGPLLALWNTAKDTSSAFRNNP